MRPHHTIRRMPRVAAMLVPLGASGCDMLGELFRAPGLGLVVLVVVVLAAIGFIVSRSARR